MAEQTREHDGIRASKRAAAEASRRWRWRSTDLFSSEEEAWIILSRLRSEDGVEGGEGQADGGYGRDRRRAG
jgi:hypothetical protein